MIDTLILRIHDVRKYRNLVKSLDIHNVKGFTTESAKVNGEDLDMLRRQGFKEFKDQLSILKRNGSGEFLVKTKVAKQLNASNHYSFAYFVNYTANHIEFNFSIPKYTYGSNVLMFVDHIGDRAYNYSDCSEIEHNIQRAYDRLEKFVIQLFRMEFVNVKFDPADIEVHRIDVCFNQVFKSKGEALKYLEYQKRKRKKHSRDEEGVIRDYATSLMYTTKRYSAKIYHKGSEYEKNDLKEHLRINKEKGKQYFKTEHYQAFADKILRYELTIRTGMLNYLHKKHLFRRKCPQWKIYYTEYSKVEASLQKNDRISKKIGTLPEEEKAQYRKEHPYDKISSDSRKVHKWVSKIINLRTYFVLGISEEEETYNKQMVNYECNKAFFSKGLLKLCLYKLVEFMNEYKIDELPEEEKIARLIDDYNLRNKSHLPKSEMVNFYKELLRIGSFRDVGKFNYLSRATIYRYKQRFKKIGITENNLIPLTGDGIPKAALDLRDYHTAHVYDFQLLNKNSFLDLL
jgi:hypothetical protein